MPDVLQLRSPSAPLDARVIVPGSKSITNRALVCAALARGRSTLRGALLADDTLAMRAVLEQLGVAIAATDDGRTLAVEGCAGSPAPLGRDGDPRAPIRLHGGSAGTVARFLPPLLTLTSRDVVLDGSEQMRGRPLGVGVEALRGMGAEIEYQGADGHLPIVVRGAGGHLRDAVRLRADVSSQYASGLLLSAPCLVAGLALEIEGDVVSRPYLAMTTAVMRAFGATVVEDGPRYDVAATGYRAADHAVEPDASAASYFFAAAAITGGRVVVPGLGTESLQGDLGFVRILEQMGCAVRMTATETELTGPAELRGVEVDMRELSDTAQTLAVVAPFATGPTRITGIGFIRKKESDRVGAVATELRRAGVEVSEEPDGLLIQPGTPRAAQIATYDDHRMAMSFALLALRTEGVAIEDPGCVAKTYPDYFADLAAVTGVRSA